MQRSTLLGPDSCKGKAECYHPCLSTEPVCEAPAQVGNCGDETVMGQLSDCLQARMIALGGNDGMQANNASAHVSACFQCHASSLIMLWCHSSELSHATYHTSLLPRQSRSAWSATVGFLSSPSRQGGQNCTLSHLSSTHVRAHSAAASYDDEKKPGCCARQQPPTGLGEPTQMLARACVKMQQLVLSTAGRDC